MSLWAWTKNVQTWNQNIKINIITWLCLGQTGKSSISQLKLRSKGALLLSKLTRWQQPNFKLSNWLQENKGGANMRTDAASFFLNFHVLRRSRRKVSDYNTCFLLCQWKKSTFNSRSGRSTLWKTGELFIFVCFRVIQFRNQGLE